MLVERLRDLPNPTSVQVEDRDDRAAVLVLARPSREDATRVESLIYTERSRQLRSHAGQISFPGGRCDPGETTEQTALREAREEVGLDEASVEVLGSLESFWVPPSQFWVTPVVATWTEPHDLSINPDEVEEVFEVPVDHLTEPGRLRGVDLGTRHRTWAWQLDHGLLWGATAIVTWRLLDRVMPNWTGSRTLDDLADDLWVRPART